MSIYSNPPHQVTIYPAVSVDDGYGGLRPGEGEPVTVRVLAQPRATDDPAPEDGWSEESVFDIFARSLPGGAWSRVVFNGADYTVIGVPRRYGVSRRTAHDVATIRKR